MKKSLITITAGIAAIGFAVPAFAAHGDSPRDVVPTHATVTTGAPISAAPITVTSNSVEDNPARIGVDDGVTSNSVEDNSAHGGGSDDSGHHGSNDG
jgi:hypothetical protein